MGHILNKEMRSPFEDQIEYRYTDSQVEPLELYQSHFRFNSAIRHDKFFLVVGSRHLHADDLLNVRLQRSEAHKVNIGDYLKKIAK